MSLRLKSPITVWVRQNEGMVVMGGRPKTTSVLSTLLCSIQERWLHLHCGQTLHLCYVRPSTFLLEDNRRIVVPVAGRLGVSAGGQGLVAFGVDDECLWVIVCLTNCMCFSGNLWWKPTLSKHTCECSPSEWHDDVTRHLPGNYPTVFYRKHCCKWFSLGQD